MRSFVIPIVAALSVFLAPFSAFGQDAVSTDEFSTLTFTPAPGSGNYLATDGARVNGHLTPTFGLTFDYAHSPFTLFTAECAADDEDDCTVEEEEAELVEYTMAAQLHATLALFERLELGLIVPVVYTSGEQFVYTPPEAGSPVIVRGGSTVALSDVRLRAKLRIAGGQAEPWGLALVAYASAPLGHITGEDRFVGDESINAGGYLVGELVSHGVHIAANAGAVYRPEATLFSTELGPQLTYAVAAGYDITPLVFVFGEVQGASTFTAEVDENPLEGRLAARLKQGDFGFTLGAGAGLISGVGVPTFRVIAGIQWAPDRSDADGDGVLDAADACPSEQEDQDDYLDEDGCPENDNDGDGKPDTNDRCPNEAEDRDGHQDDDGCPDPDNDGDGVPDGYDTCPTQLEDRDDDRDEDGCPDADTDRDGVDDARDGCPNEPEDTDGFGDEDGCPETDFDRDGIPDDQDECPDQAELINGFEDENGCPEPDADSDGIADASDACADRPETLNGANDDDGCPDGEAFVRIEPTGIAIVQQVEFGPNRATFRGRRSRLVLDALANALKRAPQFSRVRIEANASSQSVADARAQTVVEYLTSNGVVSERVQGAGVTGASDGIAVVVVEQARPASPASAQPSGATPPAPAAPDDGSEPAPTE